jgi:hypothetical protein
VSQMKRNMACSIQQTRKSIACRILAKSSSEQRIPDPRDRRQTGRSRAVVTMIHYLLMGRRYRGSPIISSPTQPEDPA